MLDSITDTLTLTGEYATANDFEVRLRALTDLASAYSLGGTTLILRGDKLCLVGCLGFEPRLAESQTGVVEGGGI
jgi:hypothetical protein